MALCTPQMDAHEISNSRRCVQSFDEEKAGEQSSVQQLFHEVKSRYQGHVFNEKYLDKNDVFAALARSTPVRKLLPESHLFTKYEQLSGMSKKYSSVFLKPVTGSLGKGIIRVSRSSKRLICQYTSVNGSVRKSYSSLSKAFPSIKNKVRGKRYLIQQGAKTAQNSRQTGRFPCVNTKKQPRRMVDHLDCRTHRKQSELRL